MYSELNLDLQAFAKRVYDSILYQSTFYKFLNTAYIGTLRQTGAPVIEVAKTDKLTVNVRETKEIQTLSKKMHNLIEKYNIKSTKKVNITNVSFALIVNIFIFFKNITKMI